MDKNILNSFLSGIPSIFSISNPYKDYDKLRKKTPLFRLSPMRWLITKYDDAVELLQHPSISHWGQDPETQNFLFGNQGLMSRTMFAFAPETNTPYRKKVLHNLAAKNLRFEADEMKITAKKILQNLSQKASIEFIKDFAHPFTIDTVSRIIGIEEENIEEWTQTVEKVKGNYLIYIIDQNPQDINGQNFINFLKNFIERKKNNLSQDLTSELIISCEEQGEDESFILSLIIFLIYAGHDNMMNFFGNAMVSLHDNKDIFQEIKENPQILKTGIDELLRYDSPVQFFMLFTKDDIFIRGNKISSGCQILVCIGAANRDPDKFETPNHIILSRKPEHLSFGSGAYRCIGSRLAQLQASTGVEEIIAAISDFKIKKNGMVWKTQPLIQRGLSELHLQVEWSEKKTQ